MTRAKTISIIAAVVALAAANAWAGGAPDEEADQQIPSKAFVGFVKDTGGNVVADAKVVASYKSGTIELVTHTDATGHYRIPGFSNDANADSVDIACSKAGYRQAETRKRRATSTALGVPVEVDCVLAPAT
jgi:hypothetical protein